MAAERVKDWRSRVPWSSDMRSVCPRRAVRLAIAVGVALTTSVLGSCSSSAKPSANTLALPVPTPVERVSRLDAIRANKSITVGVKEDVPLFGLKDPKTGELSGFDIEIAKGIAARLLPDEDPSTRVRFVEALSKDRETMLQRGAADLVISTYAITDARKQLVDFAGPYYIAGQDVLTRRELIDNGTIRGIDDVNGRKVCSVNGSTSLINLQTAAPKADISITRDKYSECFDELRRGQVDAMTTDDVILLGLALQDKRFGLTGNPFRTEPYGIGVPKGDTELRTFVNDALEDMIRTGEWAEAFRSTVGTAGVLVPAPPAIDRYE